MNRRGFLLQGVGATLAGCTGLTLATPALAKTSDRRVDRLMVHKAGRTLFLVNPDGAFLKRYPIFLGRQPVGRDAPRTEDPGLLEPSAEAGGISRSKPKGCPARSVFIPLRIGCTILRTQARAIHPLC